MSRETTRDWIRAVERADAEEQWTVLCFLAGRSVPIPAEELNASLRRAELLLAAGGDPRRRLELYGRAVTALAEDLDAPDRRAALAAALDGLRADAEGLRGAREAIALLLGDGDLAWQAYAMALIAEALADDSDDGHG